MALPGGPGYLRQQLGSNRWAAGSGGGGVGTFSFQLSCDVNLQVKVKVSELQGLLPAQRRQQHLLRYSLQHGTSAAGTAAAAAAAAAAATAAASSDPAAAQGDFLLATSPPQAALYITAVLASCQDPLCLEARTAYAQACIAAPDSAVGEPGRPGATAAPGAATARWDQWLTFSVKYRDLPVDTQLCLSLWEVCEGVREAVLLGGSTLPLFSSKGRLKGGPQHLRLWEGVQPCSAWPTTTPGKLPKGARGEAGRLRSLLQRYQRGELSSLEWLDQLTMEEVRRVLEEERVQWAGRPELRLTLVLPMFPLPVLYHQPVAYSAAAAAAGAAGTLGAQSPAAVAAGMLSAGRRDGLPMGPGGSSSPEPSVAGGNALGGAGSSGTTANIIVLADPEVGRDNPAELKAQKLARGLQRGVLDRDLKPNSEERRRLAALLRLPPNKPLAGEERELLWRFRASLTAEPRALTKFLKCVDWGDATEAKQAAELMRQWAPISAADALELLSPDFRAEVVREHAVQALQSQDPEELSLYLLQLVQALRYEAADSSRLAAFLATRAAGDPALAIQLHWYLFAELEDPGFGLRARALHTAVMDKLGASGRGSMGALVADAIRRQVDLVKQLKAVNRELKSSKVKAARATERLREMVADHGPCGELTTMRVPLPLDPAIMLVGIVPSECGVFKSAMLPLRLSFKFESYPLDWRCGSLDPPLRTPPPLPTASPAGSLGAPAGSGALGPGSPLGPAGAGAAAGAFGSASGGHHGSSGHGGSHYAAPGSPPPPDPLALLPSRTCIVHMPSSAPAASGSHHHHAGSGGDAHHGHLHGGSHHSAAAAAAAPVREYRCWMIYKKGDDLRQDQFILQMISLMDRLLKRENLDLRLTPYKVLPTSGDDGLLEFVPSVPLSAVLAEHRTIHRFLLHSCADPAGPFGLTQECVETFVRSCAGYCVMTYILGVGDRHLDNLMLTRDGRLFHIDFGYILGNDPKPFPPPMKLCKEMIEAMGGQGSDYYVQFRMYACEAYNILRKSADLILSLFHLMAGASIEAIRHDPEKAMLKLQDKFRLDFDDEQAVEWLQQLINESATALLPQIVETTHRWAQYWR